MCWKDEDQKKDEAKLQEKIKDMPEFIKNYFKFLKSSKSKLNYWSVIRLFFEWLIEEEIIKNTLKNITQEDLYKIQDVNVRDYLDELLEDKSIETVNMKMNVISGFWRYLVDHDYVRKNIVTQDVSSNYAIEDAHKEVEVPSDEQIEKLVGDLQGIKNEFVAIRDVAIIKLFIGTGIRIAELVGLDMEDLHFNDIKPHITVMAKGRKYTKREVPINQTAINAIDDYLKVRNANKELVNLNPLFLSEQNNEKNTERNRLAKSSIQKFMRDYTNNEIHPHMLRDYCATTMHRNGCSIEVISAQLGHKDINTTIRRYIKMDMSPAYEALNKF